MTQDHKEMPREDRFTNFFKPDNYTWKEWDFTADQILSGAIYVDNSGAKCLDIFKLKNTETGREALHRIFGVKGAEVLGGKNGQ